MKDYCMGVLKMQSVMELECPDFILESKDVVSFLQK